MHNQTHRSQLQRFGYIGDLNNSPLKDGLLQTIEGNLTLEAPTPLGILFQQLNRELAFLENPSMNCL